MFLEKITDYKLSIFGMMILFVVYFLPEGIVGFLRQLVAAALPHRTRNVSARDEAYEESKAWAVVAAGQSGDGENRKADLGRARQFCVSNELHNVIPWFRPHRDRAK